MVPHTGAVHQIASGVWVKGGGKKKRRERKRKKKNDEPSILHLTNLCSLPCDAYLEPCATARENGWRGMGNVDRLALGSSEVDDDVGLYIYI